MHLTVDYAIPLLNSNEDEQTLLYKRCHEKFLEMGFDEDERYQKRFDYEFSVISKRGFARYLLLAAEIVDTAKHLGAWVGPGRGSAVSSLLVFLLGITQADPIKNGLIFERFLSLDRDDEPDIDIDVEDEMRQELLGALRQKYSKERMVNVITFGTYGQKLVKRELSKYFKYTQDIRKLIYTKNSIENFNRQLRKVTKNKAIFPNDFSLMKSLYLAMADASSKWTSRMRGWDKILSQLSIFFEGRI